MGVFEFGVWGLGFLSSEFSWGSGFRVRGLGLGVDVPVLGLGTVRGWTMEGLGAKFMKDTVGYSGFMGLLEGLIARTGFW